MTQPVRPGSVAPQEDPPPEPGRGAEPSREVSRAEPSPAPRPGHDDGSGPSSGSEDGPDPAHLDAVGPEDIRRQPSRRVMEEKMPRALWVRLFVYVVGGHLLGAFLYLLFELGARGQ